jgi:hypothetical protein
VAGPCKHGNEPPGSIKCEGFHDQLPDYQLLKEYSAPWSYFVHLMTSFQKIGFKAVCLSGIYILLTYHFYTIDSSFENICEVQFAFM